MEKKIIEKKLIIVGAGPAGLTSAIYAARAGLDPLVLEKGIVGGQVAVSSIVENYPGYSSISGAELSAKMRDHAQSLDVEIDEFDEIERAELSDGEKRIITESKIYEPTAVIIATGAVPKPLLVRNEARFRGKGIHYCALCDGAAYKQDRWRGRRRKRRCGGGSLSFQYCGKGYNDTQKKQFSCGKSYS